ncbi:MAG: flagellar biosynthesis protein FlgL [Sulfurimonas sp.]|nr:flagellar biosynthesis protein FlgL [Sulfurimonas sp.]MDD3060391.1 flagellar biosynthesis protein FlgL [Sulfurimonas sp.]
MRVTSSMYYDNLFGQNNTKLSKSLFDVNKQIASGLKIQYAGDDVSVFVGTMQLDNEMTTLGQIKKSTETAYKVSNQTDVVLNDFGTSMDRMRTLMINAANASHSSNSLDALASEMRGIESHFKNLANTSINGQFLFSGSAVDIRPIDDNGIYNGNAGALNAFLGSQSQQQYNLSGAELFLGEEKLVKREVTSNVTNVNRSRSDLVVNIQSSDTIRDLMGDTDNDLATTNTHYFYLRGTKSDGTAFNEKIAMQDGEKIDELLNQIGVAYGNTGNLKVVNVSMNASGQIVIEDKIKGSSKLDFHLVGAVDFSGGNAADVTNIDLLDGGETDFAEIINPTVPPANNLFVKEFMKSSYTSASGAATNIEGLVYDRVEFNKDGSLLSSNVAHVVKESNAFADSSTKLSEVADLSQGSAGTLDGTQFTLRGTTTSGAVFDAQIDLNSTGSTFSLDTDGDGNYDNGTYDIFDMANTRAAVAADEMTYQQLMDVVNIIVSENLPTGSTAAEYDTAVKNSRYVTQTTLSYDGKLQISDLTSNDTKASFAIFDANSGNFGGDSSVMAFHANNALTIKDPKTDFFKTINEMITAVENYKVYPDALSGDVRNAGIQNAIKMMDELQMHVQRSHSKVGANSNTLTHSLERTQTLEISTMTLRASIIDTDIAESSLKLSQLSLNYEAMLSMVGKVSKLSLVNYL